MAYGLKYDLPCKTRVNAEGYSLKLSFKDYVGSQVSRNMPVEGAIVPKKGNNKFIKGTSVDFAIREEVNFEMDEFYTNDPQQIKVEFYKASTCLWSGFNLPQQLEALYKTAPVTIRFTATDGLGLLKDFEYEQTGTNTQLAMIMYCIDKIGLGLGYSIAVNLFETNHAENRTPFAQTYEDSGIYDKKTCQDVLEDILEKYNAEITQVNNRWRITCSADKESTRMLYSSAGVYEGTENAPTVLTMALPDLGGSVWPSGSPLSRSLEPGGKKVTLKHDFGRKKSLLDNYEFWRITAGEFTSWTKTGTFSSDQGIKDGKAYAFLEGRATSADDKIYQAISITKVALEPFVFEIDFAPLGHDTGTYTDGLLNISMEVRIMVALTDGAINYFLTKQGWTTDLSYISESVSSSIFGPTWNRLKIITNSIPCTGTLQVSLYRYYTASPRPVTYEGVAFSEPCVYFMSQTGELYPSGIETKAAFTASKEPNDLGTKTILAADAPDLDNKSLLYYNITRLSTGAATTLWHRPSGTGYSLLVQLARALASENRVAREKLTGIIRGEDLNFASIISHNSKKFEITEGSWDVYEELWNVTLVELLAWSSESITFTSENENVSRETTVNSDGSMIGIGLGNTGGMTASGILEQLKGVDGTGSGLDADLLDGQHGAYYAPVANPSLTGTVDIDSGKIKINYYSPVYGFGLSTTDVGGGGWARALRFFKASDGTLLGGVGGFGGENSLGLIWIGKDYNDNSAVFEPDGAAKLNYDNVKKVETTATGILVDGEVKGTTLKTANWSIEEDGTSLIIKRGSTVLARITSAGIIEAASNIKGRVTL
jgi:hypothetical protein